MQRPAVEHKQVDAAYTKRGLHIVLLREIKPN